MVPLAKIFFVFALIPTLAYSQNYLVSRCNGGEGGGFFKSSDEYVGRIIDISYGETTFKMNLQRYTGTYASDPTRHQCSYYISVCSTCRIKKSSTNILVFKSKSASSTVLCHVRSIIDWYDDVPSMVAKWDAVDYGNFENRTVNNSLVRSGDVSSDECVDWVE